MLIVHGLVFIFFLWLNFRYIMWMFAYFHYQQNNSTSFFVYMESVHTRMGYAIAHVAVM